MRDSIEALTNEILASEYDGQEWDELTEAEQQTIERQVETRIGGDGTQGTGLGANGTMYEQFQPGYFGQAGYYFVVNMDMETLLHPGVEYGFHVVDDAGLTIFEDIQTNIQETPEIRNGEDWGIAEYDWEDPTQEGNPMEEKFIAYTYYDRFEWIIAPNVYYYALQETAVEDARANSQESFESYIETRTVSITGEEHRLYDEILLADADGELAVHSYATDDETIMSDFEGQSFEETEWFQASENAPEDEVSFSEVRTTDGGQHMYISTPVYYDGEFEGVVALRFDYSTMTELTSAVSIGDSGHLAIVDPDGQFVSHPDETVVRDGETLESLGMGTLSDSVLDGETGLGTYSVNNEEGSTHFVSYSPFTIGDEQYALLASVPEQEVTEPVNALGADLQAEYTSTRNLILALFLLISGGVVAGGFVGARRISNPIQQVRDRATALSQGQIEEWEDIDARNDEIGEMVTAFESMRHELEIVAQQATALADQRFEDPAFDKDVSGQLGEALQTMHSDTQAFAEELEEARAEARAEAEELANALEQKATEFADAMEQAANGDLTKRLRTDSESEAMREIAETYNETMDDLEETITEIQRFAQEVAAAGEEASAGASEVKQASEEVSSSIQEISSGADEQRKHLEKVSSEMNNLSATIEEAASSAQTVAETSRETATVAEDGKHTSQDAIEEMEEIQQTMEETVENVEELDSVMGEISDIVDLITEIAEQTNMLALNANIEAARAGQGGENDGFAVVADEIKQLAEETQGSADDIDNLIEDLQEQSEMTVTDIHQAEQRIQNATEAVDETASAFERVVENVEQTDDGVQEISDAMSAQANSSEETVSMVDDVADISRKTASEAENVSAAAQQQASSMTQVSANVGSLTEQAAQLQGLLDRFDTGRDAGDDTIKTSET